jgi:hypothetical protein
MLFYKDKAAGLTTATTTPSHAHPASPEAERTHIVLVHPLIHTQAGAVNIHVALRQLEQLNPSRHSVRWSSTRSRPNTALSSPVKCMTAAAPTQSRATHARLNSRTNSACRPYTCDRCCIHARLNSGTIVCAVQRRLKRRAMSWRPATTTHNSDD